MKNHKIFSGLPQEVFKKLKRSTQPLFIKPMLATLTTDYFSNDEWIYEPKFDGERALAFNKDGKVNLLTRNRKNINDVYPELAIALEVQRAPDFIIDGEIVALKNGISNFELLQERINLRNLEDIRQIQERIPIVYCIFDLLYVDGYDIRNLPLYDRKELLKNLLNFNDILFYTSHKSKDGIGSYKMACRKHWEGVIAKKGDSSYVSVRSKNWLKFKCHMEQELVIGGYTKPGGSRKYFGALLVGYYENGLLKYAGKVGTGFSQETLFNLGTKLQKLESNKCPFSNYDGPLKNIHWVKPKLVGEFKFAQWTRAGRLRVPRFIGLRKDKDAREVVKEVASKIWKK